MDDEHEGEGGVAFHTIEDEHGLHGEMPWPGTVGGGDDDGDAALFPYGNAFFCGRMGGKRVRCYDDGIDAASCGRAAVAYLLAQPDAVAGRRLYYSVAFDSGAASVGVVRHVSGDAERPTGEPTALVDAADVPTRDGRIRGRDGGCDGDFCGIGAFFF